MKKIWLISFVLLTLLACSSDNDNDSADDDLIIPLEAATMLDVSYGADALQTYDIYLPAGRTDIKTKVIVLVHGGGWIEGDKEDMADFVDRVKEFHPEHAIVNINYVLATIDKPAFPNQFLDLGAVIDKITDEQESLQILPEFGLIGASAGAHISLMYDYVYDTTDAVKMVCDIVGPSNFTDPFYSDNPNFPLLLSLLVDESAYPDGTDYAVATSPALQVSSSSSPSILFYGNQDELVPLSNGDILNEKLENSGITHSYTIYDGGHGDWDAASYLDLQQKLSMYIKAHLPIEN